MDGYTNKLTVDIVLLKCYSTNIQNQQKLDTSVSSNTNRYSLTIS